MARYLQHFIIDMVTKTHKTLKGTNGNTVSAVRNLGGTIMAKTEHTIELRGLKFAAHASEETNCFEVTVYVDGKRAFIARNDGHGGPDYYNRLRGQFKEEFEAFEAKAIIASEAYQASNRKTCLWCDGTTRMSSGRCDRCDDNGIEIPATGENALEYTIDALVTRELNRRDLKKLLNKSVLMVKDGQLLESKTRPTESLVKAFAAKFPKAKILNSMDLDKALELYIQHG